MRVRVSMASGKVIFQLSVTSGGNVAAGMLFFFSFGETTSIYTLSEVPGLVISRRIRRCINNPKPMVQNKQLIRMARADMVTAKTTRSIEP